MKIIKIMGRLFCIIILFIAIASSSCNKKTSSNTTGNNTSKYQVSKVYESFGELAPRLTARPSDETIYIVNFWATWCTQCRKEIPEMVKLDEKYRKNKNIQVLFVNVDELDRQRLVKPFLRKYNITGEVVSLVDPDQGKWIEGIDKNWNGSLPGTLFFKGNKHRKFYGYPLTYPELERNIGFMKAKK